MLKAGTLVGAGLAAPSLLLPTRSWAAGEPPIGTWPAGSKGHTVYIGATVPRTGAYAGQGEDELKGMQLAVEHIHEGHPLMRKIAPHTRKGVLGKKVELLASDSGAKPNNAVQDQQRFIT